MKKKLLIALVIGGVICLVYLILLLRYSPVDALLELIKWISVMLFTVAIALVCYSYWCLQNEDMGGEDG